MIDLTINSNYSPSDITNDDHLVLVAWFDRRPGCNLNWIVEMLPEYIPSFSETTRLRVDGLSGRAEPNTRKYVEQALSGGGVTANQFWSGVWSLFDLTNDRYETTSLLPDFPLTFLPAFTVRPPYNATQAKRAIMDAFKAHEELSRKTRIFFSIAFSPRGITPEVFTDCLSFCAEEVGITDPIVLNLQN